MLFLPVFSVMSVLPALSAVGTGGLLLRAGQLLGKLV